MRPLKCYVGMLWCAWNGHEPTAGTYYSMAKGHRLACLCCKHCHKILSRVE